MVRELLMGNEAIAVGAIVAGVQVVTGYPGTPSTEIIEYIYKKNDGSIYIEWSVNEKVAVEVAAGASYAGLRTVVTMKQVGLNVASDPLMSLAYIGVKGGMVVIVADDPGPISSQTEQDTRMFGMYSKIPVFDPSSPEEAYMMVQDAFNYSEKYHIPIIVRPTTRVCHSSAIVDIEMVNEPKRKGAFQKSISWSIFPKLSYEKHKEINRNLVDISSDFSKYSFNQIIGTGLVGIVAAGISYQYTLEACSILGIKEDNYKLLKVSTPYPFPEKLVTEFLNSVDEVIVVEELDPVLERELLYLCGKKGLKKIVKGKLSGHIPQEGENSIDIVIKALREFFNIFTDDSKDYDFNIPELPNRQPKLCAGCPHRASFYAVKLATKGKKAVFSGDIGCYTLGNAKPLEMVDTCLCMGAGVTISQGLHRAESDTINFAFIGDSTFFHSGITGIINAIYNKTDIIVIILDNRTVAMTGRQLTPEAEITMMNEHTEPVSISQVLDGIGLAFIKKINPFHLTESIEAVSEAVNKKGVRVIIFDEKCSLLTCNGNKYHIDNKCIKCKKCISDLGCPAIFVSDDSVIINSATCMGCGICSYLCPVGAIKSQKKNT